MARTGTTPTRRPPAATPRSRSRARTGKPGLPPQLLQPLLQLVAGLLPHTRDEAGAPLPAEPGALPLGVALRGQVDGAAGPLLAQLALQVSGDLLVADPLQGGRLVGVARQQPRHLRHQAALEHRLGP